jgi:hypothetical protein
MNFRTKVKWINPKFCIPPHRVTHPDKFIDLCKQFTISGWDTKKPTLVGYNYKGIQLISGSHRWAAASHSNIKIPVIIYPYETIMRIWGTDEWLELLQNIPNIPYTK